MNILTRTPRTGNHVLFPRCPLITDIVTKLSEAFPLTDPGVAFGVNAPPQRLNSTKFEVFENKTKTYDFLLENDCFKLRGSA